MHDEKQMRAELAREATERPVWFGVYMTPDGPVDLYLTKEKPMNQPLQPASAPERPARRLEQITGTVKELHAHAGNIQSRLEEILHRYRGAMPPVDTRAEVATAHNQDPDAMAELDRLNWWLNEVGVNLNAITNYIAELEEI